MSGANGKYRQVYKSLEILNNAEVKKLSQTIVETRCKDFFDRLDELNTMEFVDKTGKTWVKELKTFQKSVAPSDARTLECVNHAIAAIKDRKCEEAMEAEDYPPVQRHADVPASTGYSQTTVNTGHNSSAYGTGSTWNQGGGTGYYNTRNGATPGHGTLYDNQHTYGTQYGHQVEQPSQSYLDRTKNFLGFSSGGHVQAQAQTHRSLQASKQIAYEVYANVVTAIEELEAREQAQNSPERRKRLPRSGAHLPDQGFKSVEAVKSSANAQLILFENHLKFCRKEVVEQIREELKEKTLRWMAVRQENDLPHTLSDQMAGRLFEILAKGSTTHGFTDSHLERGTMSGDQLNDNFTKIMKGNHDRSQLDRGFREDTNKKAKIPDIRGGKFPNQGADRLGDVWPSVRNHTNHYASTSQR